MTSTPPSVARQLRLLCALALRRQVNRVSAGFAWKRKKPADANAPPKRAATPGKRRRNVVFAALLAVLILFSVASMSAMSLGRIADALDRGSAEQAGKISLRPWTFEEVVKADKELKELDRSLSGATEDEKKSLDDRRDMTLSLLRTHFDTEYSARTAFERGDLDDNATRERAVGRMMEAFKTQGSSGFIEAKDRLPFMGGGLWPEPAHERAMVGALGVVLILIFATLVFAAFGGRDQPIGAVEWSLQWLFTLPATARVIFLGKLLEYTVTNFFAWILLPPFFTVIFWSAGFSGWSIPLALVSALFVAVLIGAVRVAGDTWLRKTLKPSRLRNLQAVLSVAYLVAFFGLALVVYRPTLPDFVVRALPTLGIGYALVPCSWPALLCLKGAWFWAAAAGIVLGAIAAGACAIRVSAWLVRDGLVSETGSLQGTRTRAPAAKGPGMLRGIVGKEIRLLLRDRSFFVQTLVVPVFIVALQFMINPDLGRAFFSGSSHVATIAFGIGAYVLMFGAFNVLASEGPGLWLLYTFPERIERIMRRKALLWAVVACAYALAVIAIAVGTHPGVTFASGLNMLLAAVGVFIYAYVAAGLGALGTDPLQVEPRRRVRQEMFSAYMLLVAMYAYGLYAPSIWAKVGTMTLSALLAYAIWQKVRDNAPYLLDPTQMPPPRIALSDGLIAALAFFSLQGTLVLIFTVGEVMTPSLRLLVGYAIAGAVVALGALYYFWRRKVPDLLRTVGMRLARPVWPSVRRAATVGVLWGLGAGMFGLCYVWAMDAWGPLRSLKEEYLNTVAQTEISRGWLVVLAVLAAPVFEEFIFRGLVFRGLRRSSRFSVALVASAAIFAIIHPAISVIPVFVLGLATAASFEMTGVLLAPVLAHMTYNFIVVVLAPGT